MTGHDNTTTTDKASNSGQIYQVPYFEFTCAPKHALPQHVFRGARGPKCHDLRLYKQDLNVAGQGQPKH